MPPNGGDPSVLARIASAIGIQQEQEEQQQQTMLARAAALMRSRKNQEKIKKLSKERDEWKEKADANENKKSLCFALMTLALLDDISDVFLAGVSFGLLQSITFFIPGLIRGLVSLTERDQKPDRLLRAILAMTIEAIPYINLLPTTTINLVIDWAEAYYDAEQAKNKVERLEKEIKTLKQGGRTQGRNPMHVARSMTQQAMFRRAA